MSDYLIISAKYASKEMRKLELNCSFLIQASMFKMHEQIRPKSQLVEFDIFWIVVNNQIKTRMRAIMHKTIEDKIRDLFIPCTNEQELKRTSAGNKTPQLLVFIDDELRTISIGNDANNTVEINFRSIPKITNILTDFCTNCVGAATISHSNKYRGSK